MALSSECLVVPPQRAKRAGTTTMFKTLVQHPDVVRPFLRKGVHYFDKSYDRGERCVTACERGSIHVAADPLLLGEAEECSGSGRRVNPTGLPVKDPRDTCHRISTQTARNPLPVVTWRFR